MIVALERMGNYRVSGGVLKGWWEGHFFQVCTGVIQGVEGRWMFLGWAGDSTIFTEGPEVD